MQVKQFFCWSWYFNFIFICRLLLSVVEENVIVPPLCKCELCSEVVANIGEDICLEFKQGIFVGQTQQKRVGVPLYKRMHGQGTFSFSDNGYSLNGKVYVGRFVNGLRSGYGTLFRNDSLVYRGHWSNGKRHGHGVSFSFGQVTYEGGWKNGTRSAI